MSFSKADAATVFYDLFVSSFLAIYADRIESVGLHFLFNAGVLLLIVALCAIRGRRWGKFAHSWYPMLLYSFFYYQTGLLNRVVIRDFLDDFFMGLDRAIFGSFPGIALRVALPGRFWGEVFHFFYSMYYVIIPLTALALFFKDERRFGEYIFQVSLLFYVCYAIYIFLPVEGPLHLRNFFFDGKGYFERVVNFLYSKGENPGAAFPSSHVAVALLVAWWARKVSRMYAAFCVVVLLFLSVATVYCMFHYAVDVFGGLALGGVYILAVGRWSDEEKKGRTGG